MNDMLYSHTHTHRKITKSFFTRICCLSKLRKCLLLNRVDLRSFTITDCLQFFTVVTRKRVDTFKSLCASVGETERNKKNQVFLEKEKEKPLNKEQGRTDVT